MRVARTITGLSAAATAATVLSPAPAVVLAAGGSTPSATASSLAAQSTSTGVRANCWYDSKSYQGAAEMQYWECRRTYGGKVQSSVKVRVRDTSQDRKCAYVDVRIGYQNADGSVKKTTKHWRRFHHTCTTGGWSSWKRSGWWNGDQAWEVVYAI